jgi:hypothetical protein
MKILDSGLTGLTDTEFDNKVGQIVTALTGNAKFPKPSPDLATIQTKLTTLHIALAMPDNKARTEAIKAIRADLQEAMEQLARNLEQTPGITESDFAIIDFDFHRKGTHSSEAPEIQRAKPFKLEKTVVV